jgi:hypothetical protein
MRPASLGVLQQSAQAAPKAEDRHKAARRRRDGVDNARMVMLDSPSDDDVLGIDPPRRRIMMF